MKKLITLLTKISAASFGLALRLSDKFETPAKKETPEDETVREATVVPMDFIQEPQFADGEEEEAVSEEDTKPFVFRGEDGNVIPVTMDPLPEFRIFEAMFERKYGKYGRMPMNIGGSARTYSATELYALLEHITKMDASKRTATMTAIYGSVMTVVMKAYGEKVEPKYLN